MTETGRAAWSRRYVPLVSMVVPVVLAVFFMPSALNLPQNNPTRTLEYAPMPPDDAKANPQQGNVASLSLGSSSEIAADASGTNPSDVAGLPPAPPSAPTGSGSQPRAKRCVGNPPRQTDDPISPPCVGYFAGDNGGQTHAGVTRAEVVVLFYVDGNLKSTGTDSGEDDERNLAGQYFDLAKPPSGSETVSVRDLRRFQRYFNDRYQTYSRFVHFWVYFATHGPTPTAESRRADAADNFGKLRPFAIVASGLEYGLDDVYAEAMAQRGALSFGSSAGSRPAAFYQQFPRLIWSYSPSVEERSKLISSYICTKVVGEPVADSGNGDFGKPRRLGFVSTNDPARPELGQLAKLVRTQTERCGADFVASATFPRSGYVVNAQGTAYGTRNMSAFQQASVTTVIWAGGFETDQTKAASQLNYHPEWILGGDGFSEGEQEGVFQQSDEWAHAWTVTNVVLIGDPANDPCYKALREADPGMGSKDPGWACRKPYWVDIRQLFTGIQVAGPHLTPDSIDQGFHAIPGTPSSTAQVPACYYLEADYTCVKDATVEAWDPAGSTPNFPGCWRMIEDGRRYLADEWKPGNITSQGKSGVCNQFDTPATLG